jgi:hypothetical protein
MKLICRSWWLIKIYMLNLRICQSIRLCHSIYAYCSIIIASWISFKTTEMEGLSMRLDFTHINATSVIFYTDWASYIVWIKGLVYYGLLLVQNDQLVSDFWSDMKISVTNFNIDKMEKNLTLIKIISVGFFY